MRNTTYRYLTGSLLAVALVWTATAQAGVVKEDYGSRTIFGFTTVGKFVDEAPYKVGPDPWVTYTAPKHPQVLPVGGTKNFNDVLKAAFTAKAGWTFVPAKNALSDDSLVVKTYAAFGSAGSVGAQIDVQYVPHGTDPTDDIHWIQVVTDNHNITNNPGHGKAENIVDINTKLNPNVNPYYDNGFAADSRNFIDESSREGTAAHTWIADLYLVSGPNAAGEVTVYSGLQWGWENHGVPEPSSVILLVSAIGGFGFWRRKEIVARLRRRPES